MNALATNTSDESDENIPHTHSLDQHAIGLIIVLQKKCVPPVWFFSVFENVARNEVTPNAILVAGFTKSQRI